MKNQRICKGCLAKEMPDAAYYENMYVYIRNMDEGRKASEALYEERLAVCKKCESLLNGMCRICGCFVEMRAAVRTNRCPDMAEKW